MDHILHLSDQVLPIVLLLILGGVFRRTGFLTQPVVDALKRMVINLALPAVLFLSFLRMEMKASYLALFFIILGSCVALYLAGKVLLRLRPAWPQHLPFMTTGFEYGMLGISLFGGAYGLSAIGYIAVVALGHEIFIWFVYVALLSMKREGRVHPAALLRMFISSPVIVAILAGVSLNVFGLGQSVFNVPVLGAVETCLDLLSSLTVPLILLIVGFGVHIESDNLRQAISVVAVRAALVLPLALALNVFVLRSMLGLPPAFEAGLFTLFILPPPFILPIFMQRGDFQEERTINAVLAVHTVFSVCLFVGYLALTPQI